MIMICMTFNTHTCFTFSVTYSPTFPVYRLYCYRLLYNMFLQNLIHECKEIWVQVPTQLLCHSIFLEKRWWVLLQLCMRFFLKNSSICGTPETSKVSLEFLLANISSSRSFTFPVFLISDMVLLSGLSTATPINMIVKSNRTQKQNKKSPAESYPRYSSLLRPLTRSSRISFRLLGVR